MTKRRSAALATVAAAGMLAVGTAGGAVAAHQITSGQIKNNTIRSKDIHNNTVRGKDIHNGTVGPADLTSGVRAELTAQPTLATQVVSALFTVAASSTASKSVDCPAGWRLLGGGVDYGAISAVGIPSIVSSGPHYTGAFTRVLHQGWTAEVRNDSASQSINEAVYAVCGQLGS